MEAFLTKCSICFEAETEVELTSCGDQFCVACLSRYLIVLFAGAWGIRPLKLECPVCKTAMHDDDWQAWVSSDVYDEYEHLCDRDRRLLKTCVACGHEQSLCGASVTARAEDILQTLQGTIFDHANAHVLRALLTAHRLQPFLDQVRSDVQDKWPPLDTVETPQIRQLVLLGRAILQMADEHADAYCVLQWKWLYICRFSFW